MTEPRVDAIVQPLDLRKQGERGGIRFRMDVEGRDGTKHPWIDASNVKLSRGDRQRHWLLSAPAGRDLADPEHDTVQLFRVPLLQVELTFVSGGVVWMEAVVAPPEQDHPEDDFGHFRVPAPDYDPHKLAEHRCSTCKPRHGIVPSGSYLPPPNPGLWALMAGRGVSMYFGEAR